MKLRWMQWKYSPWGTASVSQWRFALRNSFAMCMALALAYELNLEQPYWALTSAAVVSFPTVGGAISKSIARVIGSLTGASAALLLAGNALNEPWLFTLAMSGWLGLCTWASNQFHDNSAYAFQLAGYTAALIAFPMVNASEALSLWDLAQARVAEVIIGILCSDIMLLILPGNSDAHVLLNTLKNMHLRLLEHAGLLWQTETSDRHRTAHQNIISQILTMNLLRVQAFWTHSRLRQHNSLINHLLHQQLRLTSSISGIRRLLVNWPQPPHHITQQLETLLHNLAKTSVSKYIIARQLATLKPANINDYHQLAFWHRLRSFCWQYIDSYRWIGHLENTLPINHIPPPKGPPLARFIDNTEALWNGLRTFITILIIAAFSISTCWDDADGALTLAAISCALFSTIPSPQNSLKLLMKVLLILSVLIFIVKFGFMVQINALWQFLIVFLLPFTITLQLIRVQEAKLAGLTRQILVFMGSFLAVNNLPDFNFVAYLNEDLSKALGVALAWLAFAVLQPGSDIRKGRRHIRVLRRGFMDQLSQHPALNEQQFESLVYQHISQLSNSKDESIRRWLLRWGVVLLNCSHVVWHLRDWQAGTVPLEKVRDACVSLLRDVMSTRGIRQKPLVVALQQLQHICDVLAQHPSADSRELAAIIWRLYCALSQLEQTPFTLEKKPLSATE